MDKTSAQESIRSGLEVVWKNWLMRWRRSHGRKDYLPNTKLQTFFNFKMLY